MRDRKIKIGIKCLKDVLGDAAAPRGTGEA